MPMVIYTQWCERLKTHIPYMTSPQDSFDYFYMQRSRSNYYYSDHLKKEKQKLLLLMGITTTFLAYHCNMCYIFVLIIMMEMGMLLVTSDWCRHECYCCLFWWIFFVLHNKTGNAVEVGPLQFLDSVLYNILHCKFPIRKIGNQV